MAKDLRRKVGERRAAVHDSTSCEFLEGKRIRCHNGHVIQCSPPPSWPRHAYQTCMASVGILAQLGTSAMQDSHVSNTRERPN